MIDSTFAVGDKAYYPVHGVAEVVALEELSIGEAKTDVYILKVADTGLTIKIPTINAGTVGLREIMTEEEVGEVYLILQSEEGASDNQTWNRRYREYMEKIKTGSAFEIARGIKL